MWENGSRNSEKIKMYIDCDQFMCYNNWISYTYLLYNNDDDGMVLEESNGIELDWHNMDI